MAEALIPSTFLFRFAVPCSYRAKLWSEAGGAQLDESCRLPLLTELDHEHALADVRAAWNETGLALSVKVEGKRQHPWCRESRPEESDGLRVWIDTRDTHNIHRAGRFCHQFIFMPAGTGKGLDQPVAEQLLINRARENAQPVRPGVLEVRREKRIDGYLLDCFIPGKALTGWDPAEHKKLGFTYAMVDRELGTQTFTTGAPMPYHEDPSLWGTLELVRKE